jgi:hypothetical protein
MYCATVLVHYESNTVPSGCQENFTKIEEKNAGEKNMGEKNKDLPAPFLFFSPTFFSSPFLHLPAPAIL